MTSNIGSRQLKDFGQGVGFSTSAKVSSATDHERSVIESALKKAFAPEFLNRVDDVIMFNSLSKENINEIIDIELGSLYKRIENMGYKIKLEDSARDFIVDKGYDSQFGARPLKRAIQKYVEDPLAEHIIASKLAEGDSINLSYNEESKEMDVKIVKARKKKKQEEEGLENE
jgi:ATP-dependent Clp protease ATP-binding subunit ClpC